MNFGKWDLEIKKNIDMKTHTHTHSTPTSRQTWIPEWKFYIIYSTFCSPNKWKEKEYTHTLSAFLETK